MIDLLALLAGGAVGVVLGVAVLGIRRSRPVPAAPVPRGGRAPAPAPPRPAAPQAGGYPIHVNRPAPAGPVVARLEVADGATFTLGPGPVTIGRGQDQGLRVSDERASRSHAVVRPRSQGGWELADVGSANGTELNGHKVPEGRVAPLRDGDRIGVGGTIVTYREGGPTPPPPPVGPDATQVL